MATLNEILMYSDGWNGPGSKAVTSSARKTIEKLRLENNDVGWFAAADGAVQLSLYIGGNNAEDPIDPMICLEIDIASDGSVANITPILAFIKANEAILKRKKQ